MGNIATKAIVTCFTWDVCSLTSFEIGSNMAADYYPCHVPSPSVCHISDKQRRFHSTKAQRQLVIKSGWGTLFCMAVYIYETRVGFFITLKSSY